VLLECYLNSELDNVFLDFIQAAKKQTDKELQFNRNYGLEDDESLLLIDIIHLKEVVKNLLDNALKFTEKGTIELLYRMEKDHLLFRIKDTGVGIPHEKKQVIFERFRQSDNSRTRKYGGIGLGLSIVSSLVSIMKGQVWVQSKENEGTAFYFTIPYDIPTKNNKLIKKMNKLPDDTLKKMMNKQILIVEDDPASSEFVKVALEDKYNVNIVDTGTKALEYLEKSSNIDLVLLDIRLPDINGNALASKIKKEFPHITVIAQTANAMSKDKEKCLEAGCDDYLSKPIAVDVLVEMVRKYV
jgi:CheY-like chemotaxis protein